MADSGPRDPVQYAKWLASRTRAPRRSIEHICAVCGKTFESPRTSRRFCSDPCKQRAFYRQRRGLPIADDRVIDAAAADMAAQLHGLPPEARQAYRFLFARVAEKAGLLEPVGHEIRSTGERFLYREIASGALYAVERPQDWTVEDERKYVAEMTRLMLGSEALG